MENNTERANPAADGGAPQQERPTRRPQQETSSIRKIDALITEMNRRLEGARMVPVIRKAMIDAGEMSDLISQLRVALPQAVLQAEELLAQQAKILSGAEADARKTREEADRIYKEKTGSAETDSQQTRQEADAYSAKTRAAAQQECEAMLEDAQVRANMAIQSAQQQAQQLVEENEITRRAQAYALEIQDRARKDADSIYNQACLHADKMLSGAAAALSSSAQSFSARAQELAALRDQLLSPEQFEQNPYNP